MKLHENQMKKWIKLQLYRAQDTTHLLKYLQSELV